MVGKRERIHQEFEEFLMRFIQNLNGLSEEGWSLLVEGVRDELALRRLGYDGPLVTLSKLGRVGTRAFGGARKVVILTDLDREGGALAARLLKRFGHEGMRTSLSERRRLRAASKGVFLHVENLSRFAESEE